MMKKPLTHLIILSLFFVSSAFAVEYQSPRTLALGGAGRGGPLLNDSIYLNPSYASFTPIYSVSGGYTWFNTGRNYNVSVEDSRTEMLQAGVGFTRREQNSAFNLGVSKQVIQQLGFGLSSKFLVDDHNNKVTTDLMFSSAYIALQWMYASIVVDNLLQSTDGKQRNLFRTFYVGMKFIPTKEVEFYLDPLYSPDYTAGNKAGFSLGVELALLADFYLRAGRFVDAEVSYLNSRGDGYGLGLGWIGPRINFDYAMHRVLRDHAGDALTTAHALTTTIFF
jgi:hypothetical protein